MSLSRRVFIRGTLAASLCWPFVARAQDRSTGYRVFGYGVASGDPLADRVVLWTRVAPSADAEVEVRWQVARDTGMQQLVARGTQPTTRARDFTVKVDVAGLEPATTYYYQFEAIGTRSPIGRTRTLPVGRVGRVRLAVASCSNYPWGYFNAYRRIAERADLDAVLHLGDYIYEYQNGEYGDGTSLGRVPLPDKEMITLADYRLRHATYKGDPDLQEAHRQHPFITVWDDHEVTNNPWVGGAENHNPDEGEGDWLARRAVAVRAYFEWMPIRDPGMTRQLQIYRAFPFGDLLDLVMLDTRLTGRDQQVAREDVTALSSPSRTLLGPAQEAWLGGELIASKQAEVRWRVLGQQVMFGPTFHPEGGIRNPDAWDGYQAARQRLFDLFARERLDNLVVLTGDVHSSWALDVAPDPQSKAAYDPDTGRGALAVEYVTPGITSPGAYTNEPDKAESGLAPVRARNPHIKLIEAVHRGYMIVDVTPERAQAEWFFTPNVTERTTEERFAAAFATAAGAPHVVAVPRPLPPRTDSRPLAPDSP
ncbi:MAG: alkaline phosphatase [Luteitalea sp.]|nr:alkaline phosphatase [Luteitalea sp.]